MEEIILKALGQGLVKLIVDGGPMGLVFGISYWAHKAIVKEKDARLAESQAGAETLVKIIQENTDAQHSLRSSLDNLSLQLNTWIASRKRA